MSTDVENVVALQESMRQQFRTLRPSIFPKQFAHFRDARNLANSAEGRAIIDDVLKRNVSRAPSLSRVAILRTEVFARHFSVLGFHPAFSLPCANQTT